MILTNSSAAKVQGAAVTAIISVSSTFLQFMQYSALTVSAEISGTIGLVKNGIGELTLSGICNYTGPTQINGGSLAIISASTLNGVISGDGSLTKTGVTALTLGGINTYSGGTLSAPSSGTGTISISSNNGLGTGLFTSAGPSQIIAATTITLTNNFQINSGASLQFRTNIGGTILTISGNIAGAGSLNKTSPGSLRLNGVLSYTGSTNITAGTLRAIKTSGASTATATFPVTGNPLSVSFDVPPTVGMTFRFFQGTTTNTYATVNLIGATGRTGTYNSANSTLTIL